jgi:hypothetical protein
LHNETAETNHEPGQDRFIEWQNRKDGFRCFAGWQFSGDAEGGAGSHQVEGEVGVRRGEDHIVTRTEENHFEAVVSDERVVQQLRNALEIFLRLPLLKGVTGQLVDAD